MLPARAALILAGEDAVHPSFLSRGASRVNVVSPGPVTTPLLWSPGSPCGAALRDRGEHPGPDPAQALRDARRDWRALYFYLCIFPSRRTSFGTELVADGGMKASS